ncbi:MAG: lipid-A-disaccharide synthase [Deltaproteobacteria bacterium]
MREGPRILMVAGEASGDAQAARLAAAMLETRPQAFIYGTGGEAMRRAGVHTSVDISELSVMGIVEVVGALGRIRRCYRMLKADLRSQRPPDLLVLVDFPDFNLPLARVAKRAGVKVLYYVSPQVWAWRRGRIGKLSKRVDRMIALFPFEVELYRSHGLDTHFVGHPLAEDVCATRPGAQTRALHGLPADALVVTLMPGSRSREIKQMLPLMLDAARGLDSKVGLALARAPGLDPQLLEGLVADSGLDIAIVGGDTYNLIAASDVVSVTSGTATVECALLGTPMVVSYRMSPCSYAIARVLVRVPFVAMPNIILGREVVPEFVQSRATAANIGRAINAYLESADLRRAASEQLADIAGVLVSKGAAGRAAGLAWEMLA